MNPDIFVKSEVAQPLEKALELNVLVGIEQFNIIISIDGLQQSPGLQNALIAYLSHRTEAAAAWFHPGVRNGTPEPRCSAFAHGGFDDLQHMVLNAFKPLFRTIPPLRSDRQHGYTLNKFLLPPTHWYTVQAKPDSLIPVSLGYDESSTRAIGIPYPANLDVQGIDKWDSTDIDVPDNDAHTVGLVPTLVLAENLNFFKSVSRVKEHMFASEYAKLVKIGRSKPVQACSPVVRVSRLVALVFAEYEDPDMIRIVGLLLEHIDCGGRTLRQTVAYRKCSSELRQKWTEQITHSLKTLHENDITWGDATADNVLIDRNEDAWIVDFGGGRSDNWLLRKMKNTIGCDLAGLDEIVELLKDQGPEACSSGSELGMDDGSME